MTEEEKTTGPLAGIRVLDLTRVLAGPMATQLLGDFGADVLKIEKPGLGDDTRAWGPPFLETADGSRTRESAYYLSANRNKRSVEVDIASAAGQKTICELLSSCDVLIENFRVGGLKKYGLAYDDLKDRFPSLVYCSITGFGQTGPNADKAGYDLMAQGCGGIMSLTGDPAGEPMKVGVAVADVMAGMYAATAILAALRHRDRTNEGQHIDIGLVDSQVAWLINAGTSYLMTGEEPKRYGNQHPNIVPYQVFEAKDGHVIVAIGNDQQFRKFCEVIGRPDLGNDPRFESNVRRLENRETLIETIAETLKTLSRDKLISEMEARGIPCGPINTLGEVFDSEQVAARDMKVSMKHPLAASGSVDLIGNPVKFSKTPVTYRRAPPTCGEHTDDVRRELENTGRTDSCN